MHGWQKGRGEERGGERDEEEDERLRHREHPLTCEPLFCCVSWVKSCPKEILPMSSCFSGLQHEAVTRTKTQLHSTQGLT